MRNLRVDARSERRERQRQADEVEVFELFGGGLPVIHHIVTVRTKGMGDRSAKPFRLMTLLRGNYFMSVDRSAGEPRCTEKMDIHERYFRIELCYL